jgi:GT2 family glycosyltransferase
MKRVSIVIPNWNTLKHLPECMTALAAQTYTDFETIVVDNASQDDSVAYLKREWPDVRVVELDHNTGFPGAVNAGLRASDSPYVVLLNNDTRAEPDWLERLVTAMDAHPEFSFASSKLLRFDTPDLIDSAGHVYSIWLGAADNIGEEQPATRYTEEAWIFGACAAASIYRRSLFEDIGGYDDDFFFTHEDVDFDLRANVAGHRGFLVPNAIVYHKRGATYSISAELNLMGVRNRIWCAGKNLPPLALAVWIGGKVLRVVWWIPARLVGFTPGRKVKERPGVQVKGVPWKDVKIRDAVRAAVEALIALPAKRRALRKIRRLSSIEFLRVVRATREPVALSEYREPTASR